MHVECFAVKVALSLMLAGYLLRWPASIIVQDSRTNIGSGFPAGNSGIPKPPAGNFGEIVHTHFLRDYPDGAFTAQPVSSRVKVQFRPRRWTTGQSLALWQMLARRVHPTEQRIICINTLFFPARGEVPYPCRDSLTRIPLYRNSRRESLPRFPVRNPRKWCSSY